MQTQVQWCRNCRAVRPALWRACPRCGARLAGQAWHGVEFSFLDGVFVSGALFAAVGACVVGLAGFVWLFVHLFIR